MKSIILVMALTIGANNTYAARPPRVSKAQLQAITRVKITELKHTCLQVIKSFSKPPQPLTISIPAFKQQEKRFHVPPQFIKKTR